MDDGQVTQPLQFNKEALVSRLQEVKDEHEQARADAAAKVEERRKALLDATGDLSEDQVANMLNHFTGLSGDKLVEWIEDKVAQEKFVTVKQEPTAHETNLDRWIRVLGLSSNTTIEVKPSDSIYSYL